MLSKNIDKWTRAMQLSVHNVDKIKYKKSHISKQQIDLHNQSKIDIMHDMLNRVLSLMNPYDEQQSEGTFSEIYMDKIGKIKGMNHILTVKNVNMTDEEIDDFYKEKGDNNDN